MTKKYTYTVPLSASQFCFFFNVTQDLSIRSNWAKSTQHPALFYFIFVNLLFLWTSCESIVISKNKQWVQSQMSETSGRIFYILSNETILPHFNGPKVNIVHIFIGYFENKEKQTITDTQNYKLSLYLQMLVFLSHSFSFHLLAFWVSYLEITSQWPIQLPNNWSLCLVFSFQWNCTFLQKKFQLDIRLCNSRFDPLLKGTL